MASAKVAAGTMRVRAYEVLRRAVEEGVASGYRRAHKYLEKPTEDELRDHIEGGVMNAIAEWFDFDDDVGR